MHKRNYEIAADIIDTLVERAIEGSKAKCESPIERMLIESFIMSHIYAGKGVPPIDDMDGSTLDPLWGIKTQYKIGNYRADFLFINWEGRVVLVECDGHDFHERTKEQAARDRKKDREIQAEGYVILRYTGSEIFANPFYCAADVISKAREAPRRVQIENLDIARWLRHGDGYPALDEFNRLQFEALKAAELQEAE